MIICNECFHLIHPYKHSRRLNFPVGGGSRRIVNPRYIASWEASFSDQKKRLWLIYICKVQRLGHQQVQQCNPIGTAARSEKSARGSQKGISVLGLTLWLGQTIRQDKGKKSHLQTALSHGRTWCLTPEIIGPKYRGTLDKHLTQLPKRESKMVSDSFRWWVYRPL